MYITFGKTSNFQLFFHEIYEACLQPSCLIFGGVTYTQKEVWLNMTACKPFQ